LIESIFAAYDGMGPRAAQGVARAPRRAAKRLRKAWWLMPSIRAASDCLPFARYFGDEFQSRESNPVDSPLQGK
jgi:hypothetical protein